MILILMAIDLDAKKSLQNSAIYLPLIKFKGVVFKILTLLKIRSSTKKL